MCAELVVCNQSENEQQNIKNKRGRMKIWKVGRQAEWKHKDKKKCTRVL